MLDAENLLAAEEARAKRHVPTYRSVHFMCVESLGHIMADSSSIVPVPSSNSKFDLDFPDANASQAAAAEGTGSDAQAGTRR